MNNLNNRSAVIAFLDENKRAIRELQKIIADLSDKHLVSIADEKTENPDCRSIQTVLAHVVSSGFSYCIYIRDHKNMSNRKREKHLRSSVAEYIHDLDEVIRFTAETFEQISNDELEEPDQEKKIRTNWGQYYDIEQLMEHAIVHILRHRRQIEKFKLIVNK